MRSPAGTGKRPDTAHAGSLCVAPHGRKAIQSQLIGGEPFPRCALQRRQVDPVAGQAQASDHLPTTKGYAIQASLQSSYQNLGSKNLQENVGKYAS